MKFGMILKRRTWSWYWAVRSRIAEFMPRVEEGFLVEYREAGLRMVLGAALIGILIVATFIFVGPFSQVTSQWLFLLRVLMLVVLGLFSLAVVFRADFVLRNYVSVCTTTLISVFGALALLIRSPGVIAVDEGYSSAPVLLFSLFLLYGFVRLPVLVLLSVGSFFTAAVLGAERDVSEGAVFYRIGLYALLSNLVGAFLALSIYRREATLFYQRRSLAEARDLLYSKNSQLKILHEEKNLLLAAMNHDVKQPLLALDVYLNTLKKGVSVTGSSHLAEAVAAARDALLYVRYAMEDLLESCRIELGKERKLNRVEVSALVAAAAEVCAQLAIEKSVKIRVRLARGELVGFTDAALLGRIVQNLLINAIKFTALAGRSSSSVLVAVRRRGSEVSVAVIDQGRGIPPDEIGHIWRPFFRSAFVDGGGSGLGLFVVSRAIKAMARHSISVDSRLGRGTRFTVMLPRFEMMEAGEGERGPDAESDGVLEGAYVVLIDLGLPRVSELNSWIGRHGALVDRFSGLGDMEASSDLSDRLVDAVLVCIRRKDAIARADELGAIVALFPVGTVIGFVSDELQDWSRGAGAVLPAGPVIFLEDLAGIRSLIGSGLEKNIRSERERA
jgi:signal transduction histidine kinase